MNGVQFVRALDHNGFGGAEAQVSKLVHVVGAGLGADGILIFGDKANEIQFGFVNLSEMIGRGDDQRIVRSRFGVNKNLPDVPDTSVFKNGQITGEVVLEPAKRILKSKPKSTTASGFHHHPFAIQTHGDFVDRVYNVARDGFVILEIHAFDFCHRVNSPAERFGVKVFFQSIGQINLFWHGGEMEDFQASAVGKRSTHFNQSFR